MLTVPGLATLLFSLWLAPQPPVSVLGGTSCPTPVEVEGRVARLLAPGSPGVEPDRVVLRAVPDGIRIELRRPDGAVVGERTLATGASPSCEDLAEAIAVVVVIWELPLHPGLVPPPLEPIAVAARTSAVAVQAHTGAPAPARWRFEMGAAFQTVLPDVVPGVLIEGVARDTTSGWGARLALGGTWWSDAALGPGQVSWTRTMLALGVIRGWSRPSLFADLRGQVLVGALGAAGRGFDETATSLAFDGGVGAGLRVGAWLGRRFAMWVDAGVTYWPIDQQIGVVGVAETLAAPRFDGAVSLGGTFVTDH